MIPVAEAVRARVQAIVAAHGTPITYRRVRRLAGPGAAINPPIATTVTVSGAQLTGATSIAITGVELLGYLRAGDALKIGAQTFSVTADTQAAGHAAVVPVTPALPSDLAGGEAVTLVFSGDHTVVASWSAVDIRKFPQGADVQVSDMTATIAADALPLEPTLDDQLIVSGKRYAIKSIRPGVDRGATALWVLQARS